AYTLVIPSFPTRRSSDLVSRILVLLDGRSMLPRLVSRLIFFFFSWMGIHERATSSNGKGTYFRASDSTADFSSSSGILGSSITRSEEHTSELQSREKLVC